jgi:glycosyltransferase involved in cell wall biosynthesis
MTLWQRKLHLERRGHRVDIFNTLAIHDTIYRINRRGYDFAHCHRESFVGACNAHLKVPFAVTSHDGWLHQYASGAEPRGPYEYQLRDMLQSPANLVLSEPIRRMYVARGYRRFLRVMRNAVEADRFRVADRGNGRAVCVGRMCRRKRQAWLADCVRGAADVDFVGPGSDDAFRPGGTVCHLGPWTRSQLYEQLTNYSCLVAPSLSEGAPKVVLEALAAGVSVVVTEAAAANLAPHPFITVLPDGEVSPEVVRLAIRRAIEENPRYRTDIRAYALAEHDYPAAVAEYERVVSELLEWHSG